MIVKAVELLGAEIVVVAVAAEAVAAQHNNPNVVAVVIDVADTIVAEYAADYVVEVQDRQRDVADIVVDVDDVPERWPLLRALDRRVYNDD